MAYSQIYSAGWSSQDTSGYLYIDEWNGTPASGTLVLAQDGIVINNAFTDWETPIIGQNAQITILNDATTPSTWWDLLPLMTGEERKYRVRINQTSPDAKQLFEGYLNTDVVEQPYKLKGEVRLIASNYLKKLENVSPTILETPGKRSFIDLIIECLKLTGTEDNVNVNMSLYPYIVSLGTTKTALNTTGVDTQVFWQNNVDRDSANEILTKILKTFDSFIYWYNGEWYIERYRDIGTYPKHYVRYDINSSYSYSDVGTSVNVNDVSLNIFGYNHLGAEQLISINPGVSNVEIKLEPIDVVNFINRNMNIATPSTSLPHAMNPTNLKEIIYYQNATYHFPGYNGVALYGYANRTPYSTITSGLMRYGWPTTGTVGVYDYDKASICSKFKVTVDTSDATQTINMKWKYIPIGDVGGPRNNDYKIRWFLKEAVNGYMICEDTEAGHWTSNPTVQPSIYAQTIEVPGTELEKGSNMATVSVSVPITDPSILNIPSGDTVFIFGIMIEQKKLSTEEDYTENKYPMHAVYGDIEITVSGQKPQENTIRGIATTRFLNKKEISLDIFDIKSLNYINGVYYTLDGDNQIRTWSWNDTISTSKPLSDLLLTNKYQLYNVSRQSISSTIKYTGLLKPLSMWYDSNQASKKFVLTGYSFVPSTQSYSCQWDEYDNTTQINLNEVTT